MTTLSRYNPALQALLLRLPDGLRQHIERVRAKALELARLHGVDLVKVEMAALGHDLARGMKDTDLRKKALSYGLTPHPIEEMAAVLLHGPVGAEMLRRECGIEDQEVLEAVRWHTTFGQGLGPVSKVLFLADKLEPQKVQGHPLLEGTARLAVDDLDAAVLSYLQEDIPSMIRAERLVHPASLEGYNELLAIKKGLQR